VEGVGGGPKSGQRLGGVDLVSGGIPLHTFANAAVEKTAFRVALDKGFVHL